MPVLTLLWDLKSSSGRNREYDAGAPEGEWGAACQPAAVHSPWDGPGRGSTAACWLLCPGPALAHTPALWAGGGASHCLELLVQRPARHSLSGEQRWKERGRAPCPSQDTQQPDFHPSPTSRRPIATQEHHGQGPSHQHRGSGEPQDPGGAGRAGALLRRTQMTGSRVACSSTERECRDAGSLAHSQERGFSVCPSQAVVRV